MKPSSLHLQQASSSITPLFGRQSMSRLVGNAPLSPSKLKDGGTETEASTLVSSYLCISSQLIDISGQVKDKNTVCVYPPDKSTLSSIFKAYSSTIYPIHSLGQAEAEGIVRFAMPRGVDVRDSLALPKVHYFVQVSQYQYQYQYCVHCVVYEVACIVPPLGPFLPHSNPPSL